MMLLDFDVMVQEVPYSVGALKMRRAEEEACLRNDDDFSQGLGASGQKWSNFCFF